jgi:hypothetical protein
MLQVGILNQLNDIQNTKIKVAFVSTNSIVQGEQTAYFGD